MEEFDARPVEPDDVEPLGLARFVQRVRALPPTSARRERELARRAEVGDRRARQELIECGLPSAVALAGIYARRGLDFGELVDVALVGLVRAVDHFEWRRGFRLSTCADAWIRKEIYDAFRDRKRHAVEVPTVAKTSTDDADDGNVEDDRDAPSSGHDHVERRVLARELLQLGLRALDEMPEDMRAAFLLDALVDRHVEGVDQSAAARLIGVSTRRFRDLRDAAVRRLEEVRKLAEAA